MASSLQVAIEQSVLELTAWLHSNTGGEPGPGRRRCAQLRNERARPGSRSVFRRIWVQPAAGDAGTALGAALWIDAQSRKPAQREYHMDHVFLGPQYGDDEIEDFLRWTKVRYRKLENVPEETAELLTQDRVIGWFQGRMEFGPRALGARSILASPIPAEMQARLNEIKDRARTFGLWLPWCSRRRPPPGFRKADVSPFMLFVFDVRAERADRIPAVRHVDGTARVAKRSTARRTLSITIC